MKKLYVAALVLAIPMTVALVMLLGPTQVKSEEPKSQSTEIRLDNFTFAPAMLTVPVNSTVTWVNKDDIPHVIASSDGLFKSKALDTDDKFSHTFTQAGTYAYYCTIHPKMQGKVVVQ
jgi:plastocyanin